MTRILASLAILGAAAFGADPKIASDLKPGRPGEMFDVVISFVRGAAERGKAKVTQNGGQVRADLGIIRGAAVSLPWQAIERLAADPDVEYIAPNRRVHPLLDFAAATTGAAAAFQSGLDGRGIGIAMIDSGISASAALRVVHQQWFGVKGGIDHYGHGMHVAGILAGDGAGSGGRYRGVAPGAHLVSLQVLDDRGQGQDSNVIAALQRAIELKRRYNIRVVNISVGRPVYESYDTDPLCKAVEAAWQSGLVVVVAAGNQGRDGYGTITSPGNHPYVITVGAMKTRGTALRPDDEIASYSSKGPTAIDLVVKPDLVAPGNLIVSLGSTSSTWLAREFPQNKVAGGHFVLSGTSMAAPMVSGAAAVLLQKDPTLTPDDVKARLMATASKDFPEYSVSVDGGNTYVSRYDAFTVGAGYLDIEAALNSTERAGAPAWSPAVVYDAETGTVELVTDLAAVWRRGAVWGTAAVWGRGAVWGTDTVWGTDAVFAAGACWGRGAVWGTGAIWANSYRGEN